MKIFIMSFIWTTFSVFFLYLSSFIRSILNEDLVSFSIAWYGSVLCTWIMIYLGTNLKD